MAAMPNVVDFAEQKRLRAVAARRRALFDLYDCASRHDNVEVMREAHAELCELQRQTN
jgi:hypothetical protein